MTKRTVKLVIPSVNHVQKQSFHLLLLQVNNRSNFSLKDYMMLRKIRLTFAILFFTVITLLFLDFTGTLHAWFGWMAKIQFLPALLALNVGVVLLLVVLTLLVGRVYWSVICPLGMFQDIVSWISGRRKKKKYRSPSAWIIFTIICGTIVFSVFARCWKIRKAGCRLLLRFWQFWR